MPQEKQKKNVKIKLTKILNMTTRIYDAVRSVESQVSFHQSRNRMARLTALIAYRKKKTDVDSRKSIQKQTKQESNNGKGLDGYIA